jgi:uncharacterized protein (DUF1778 family)
MIDWLDVEKMNEQQEEEFIKELTQAVKENEEFKKLIARTLEYYKAAKKLGQIK